MLWAFGASGVGRSTALLFDVNGEDSFPLQSWKDFAAFLGATVRWTTEVGHNPDATLEIVRDGQDLVATLDIAPAVQMQLTETPSLVVVTPDTGAGEPQRAPLRQQPDGTWQTRIAMEQNGLYHAAAQLGAFGVVRAAPAVLPYSAEYRFWEPERADECLNALLGGTGGQVRTKFTDV